MVAIDYEFDKNGDKNFSACWLMMSYARVKRELTNAKEIVQVRPC
jgi:hypothetical protein